MRAAFLGDGVELLGALELRGEVTDLFEIGQRRIDDARARRVPVGGLFLERFDDVVAVARLLVDQCQRDQAQVALRQHAAGMHQAVAASLAAEAVTAAETVAMSPAPASGEFLATAALVTFVTMSKHGNSFQFSKIYQNC